MSEPGGDARGGLIPRLAAALEVPSEVAGQIKLAVCPGELRALNHQGLLIYEKERIVLRCPGGRVEVRGRELTMTELTPQLIHIKGRVLAVLLPGASTAKTAAGGKGAAAEVIVSED